MNLKENKHIWLPALLLIYFAIMAYQGRDILIVAHQYVRYFLTVGFELLVIVLLYFFLKKKKRIRLDREAMRRRTDALMKESESAELEEDNNNC